MYSEVQYSTVRWGTLHWLQYSTRQYSTVYYSKIPLVNLVIEIIEAQAVEFEPQTVEFFVFFKQNKYSYQIFATIPKTLYGANFTIQTTAVV